MDTVCVTLLRAWVYVVWNVQQLVDIIRKKRDAYLPITDLRVVHNADGLLVLDKSPELLMNSINPWRNYVTLQMQVKRSHLPG